MSTRLSSEIVDVETLASAQSPESAFLEFRESVESIKTTAETLAVVDENDTAGMKLAKDTRLALRSIRLEVESRRKDLKEESLRRGQRVDAAARSITSVIEPLELRMSEQEQFATRAAADRKAKIGAERAEAMGRYGPLSSFAAGTLAALPEADFQKILADTKELHESRLAKEQRERKEAAARAKAEADERERMQMENERLRTEATQRDAAAKLERDRVEAEARKEREAREAAEKRLRDLEAAEAAKKRAEAMAAKAAAEKPRREQLKAYAASLAAVPMPQDVPELHGLVRKFVAQVASLLDDPNDY